MIFVAAPFATLSQSRTGMVMVTGRLSDSNSDHGLEKYENTKFSSPIFSHAFLPSGRVQLSDNVFRMDMYQS